MGTTQPSALLIACTLLLTSACNDEAYRRWNHDISFPEAEALLTRGPRRLDLKVRPEGELLVARGFEVEHDHELLDDEIVEAQVVQPGFLELDPAACIGTLAHDVPGIDIVFDGAVTRFEGPRGSQIDCAALVERITRVLDGGSRPLVRAQRRPARVPQDRDDPGFLADSLRLVALSVEPHRAREIEINVGPENLVRCDAILGRPADCVGAVRVLDQIVVARRGVTEVETEMPFELVIVELDANVRSVDPNARELLLTDGRPVRIADGTEIEDVTRRVGPLPGFDAIVLVEEAMARGARVRVRGRGAVQAAAPVAVVAIELTLRFDEGPDAREDDEVGRVRAVQGVVVGVDPELGLIALPSEIDIVADENTRFVGHVSSLRELDVLVRLGTRVRAEIVGAVETDTPRTRLRAQRVRTRVLALPLAE